MATQPDDALDQDEIETPETEEIERPEAEQPGEDEGDEIVFGDETEAAPDDTSTIRHLREELKKARAAARERPATTEAPIDVGPEPNLEDEGIDYDQDIFKEEWRKWNERKTAAERQKAKAGESDQRFQQEWQQDHQSYLAKRSSLTFADVDEVEGVATAVLDPAQQVTIVQVADNPALILYALGKHPAKLAEISAITNPLKLAKAITQLEGKLTVKSRSRAPDPEEVATGTASITHKGGNPQKRLEEMEKEWEKKGGSRRHIMEFKKANGLM